MTNEELYLFQKLLRGVLGTNHIDHAGGYSYAAHLALRDSLGYAASTNSINEIRKADVILALRSDLSETHPVIKSEVVLAVKRRKAKLIVVNSRNIHLNKFSALNLRVKPGSEVSLVNGMMEVILREGLANEEFIQSRTEGMEALKRALESYIPGEGRGQNRCCGGESHGSRPPICQGQEWSDLNLRRPELGKAGPGPGAGRSQPGPSDREDREGKLRNLRPGGKEQRSGRPGYGRDSGPPPGLCRFKGCRRNVPGLRKSGTSPSPVRPGMGALAILQAIEEGKIKGLYLAGENPLVTYPDSARTKEALASLDFLVVQDCFLTETASLAHVVFPAVTFAEKEGTFTNVDRRVQRVRPALRPLGEARSDSWIFQNPGSGRWGSNWGRPQPRR